MSTFVLIPVKVFGLIVGEVFFCEILNVLGSVFSVCKCVYVCERECVCA